MSDANGRRTPALDRGITPTPGVNYEDVGAKHWLRKVHRTRLSSSECRRYDVTLRGGSDYGEFITIGAIATNVSSTEVRKRLQFAPGDILLRLQTQALSGFTLRDALEWLKALLDSPDTDELVFETVRSGALPRRLQPFLHKRFRRGSPDHQLQQTIRNNLYLRTVPCTTRTPRIGEVDGTHYCFVTVQQFRQLERNGLLLECGSHAGNYYGTPRPPHGATALRLSLSLSNLLAAQDSATSHLQNQAVNSAAQNQTENCEEDAHLPVPFRSQLRQSCTSARSSPLQSRTSDRISHRSASVCRPHSTTPARSSLIVTNSNYTSMAAALNNVDNPPPSMSASLHGSLNIDTSTVHANSMNRSIHSSTNGVAKRNSLLDATPSDQSAQQAAAHEFPDLNVANGNSATPSDGDDELPYGWERVVDPQYGVYYIDHVQKRTQYEHPSVTLKDRVAVARPPAKQLESPIIPYNALPPFTLDASSLPGERVCLELVKGIRGFGFSLVGSDRADDSYLQVKSILRHGPADVDGRLSRGDILVGVNGESVLGYSYDRIVHLFQSIAIGSRTELTVSKYYRLPFDQSGTLPRVVRQVAVDPVSEMQPDLQTQHQSADNTTGTGLVHIRLRKIEQSFGFTIARNANGLHYIHNISPNVEQCRALHVGDILFSVDSINVLQAPHTEIVALFKRVQPGQQVLLTVLRLSSHTAEHHDIGVETVDQPLVTVAPTLRHSVLSTMSASAEDPLMSRDAALSSAVVSPALSASPSATSSSQGQPPNSAAPRTPPTPPAWDSFEVRLRRNDKGFGFRLIGGYEHGEQVAIGFVLPTSPADEAGLRPGDQIVAVDHMNMLGATHADTVRYLTQAARERGECTLRLRRRKDTVASSNVDWSKIERGTAGPESGYSSGPASNSNSSAPVTVTVNSRVPDSLPIAAPPSPTRNEGTIEITLRRAPHETFGFVIVSSTTRTGQYVGEFVGRIVAASPADRCSLLRVGQRIVAVNSVPIAALPHEAVVQLIKDSQLTLSLSLVDTPLQASPVAVAIPMPPTSTQGALDPLSAFNVREAALSTDPVTRSTLPTAAFAQPPVTLALRSSSAAAAEPSSQTEVVELELARTPSTGFGFSLRGGREFGQPLAVHRIADGSSAVRDGRVMVGDEILAINGRSTTNLTHQQAVELVQTSGLHLQLLLRKSMKLRSPSRTFADASDSKSPVANITWNGASSATGTQTNMQLNPSGPTLANRYSVTSTRVSSEATTPIWTGNSQLPNSTGTLYNYAYAPNNYSMPATMNMKAEPAANAGNSNSIRPAQWQAANYASMPTPLNGKSSEAANYAQHSSSYRV